MDVEVTEPVVDVKAMLSRVCEDTAIYIDMVYTVPPRPAVSEEDFTWIQSLLA